MMRLKAIIISGLICFAFSYKEKKDERPFSEIDFSKGNYKLYFISEYTEGELINKNFYIDDNNTLQKIKDEIIQEIFIPEKSDYNILFVRLMKDKEVLDGGLLDTKNHAFLYHNGSYKFNWEKFQKYKSSFKKLKTFIVYCKTLTNFNKFFEFINKSSGFMNVNTIDQKNPFKDFKGIVELKTDTSGINFENRGNDIYKKFMPDFKLLGKVEFSGFSYQGGDSITLTMLWDHDFSDQLPANYHLTKPFTDSIDDPITVYDISEKEIIDFFQSQNINGYKIVELK